MASIGCPFKCSYCGNDQLRKVGQFKMIKRSVDGVIAELKEMKKNGAKYILFVDDILTMDKEWFKEFACCYKAQIDLPYGCFVHAKCIDAERAALLKMSGCESAWMGIQTGMEVLRQQVLNRTETNDEIKSASKALKDEGIKLIVDHIFGIPKESDMSQEISINLLNEIKPDIVNCYELLYFPKAEIIKHALEVGYLTTEDVAKLDRGEGIVYQMGNKGQHFFDKFVKAFVVIPLGGNAVLEFLPTWLLKVFVFIRAKRTFIIRVMIENEIFFTYRAILKKLGLDNERSF
jgi:pyruvate-formate lyase-activating enzyme